MSTQRPPRTPLVPPGGMECHVADLTACFSADVTLRAAQEELARHDQWLPIDGDPDASLGWLVATNSTGPLRLGFGAWRDLLLGAQFLNGRGQLISAGGRTVKNVAGYDLTKFIIGQGGVFGCIVTLTTRTYKRPAGAIVARFPRDVAILPRLLPTPLKPQWAMLISDALLCGYVGDTRTLDFYEAKLQGAGPRQVIRRSLEEDMADRRTMWAWSSNASIARISVAPSKVMQLIESLRPAQWSADAAFGIVILPAPSDLSKLQSTLQTFGAAAVIVQEDGILAPAPGANERDVLVRLKQSFDPDNTLRPLRFYP